jgi:hypothetical protein
MFCDCSCDAKIPLGKLPTPEDLPNILFSENYDLVGSIDALPRVNKDFYSDFQVVDKTYEQSVYKTKDFHEKFNRNLPKIRNDFKSYNLRYTRFDKEEYYHDKYSSKFIDEDENKLTVKIINENLDDLVSYPIEFTRDISHREGGCIQVLSVYDKITAMPEYLQTGVNSNITTSGVSVQRISNRVLDYIEGKDNIPAYCDQTVNSIVDVQLDYIERNIYQRDNISIVSGVVPVIKRDNMTTYYEVDERANNSFIDDENNSFYDKSYNKDELTVYSRCGYDNDLSDFKTSQSLSFQGCVD